MTARYPAIIQRNLPSADTTGVLHIRKQSSSSVLIAIKEREFARLLGCVKNCVATEAAIPDRLILRKSGSC